MITEMGLALERLSDRKSVGYESIQKVVDGIVEDVRLNKDAALIKYTEKFDNVRLTEESLRVTQTEIDDAFARTEPELIEVIGRAARRVEKFHCKQKQNSWIEPEPCGETLGQMIRAIENVGVYVPGGKASYPSSLLMNVIPAYVAGVKNIILTTPALPNGKVNDITLVAAKIAGVTEIIKVGGAQAIAALAYGTETVKRVDKIVGPGNVYVSLAKKSVFGEVGIDSVAGPSEILIIADETANPVYVAADLLSQAEHDEMASAILVSTSESLIKNVEEELVKQTAKLSRRDIIEKSLENYGIAIHVKSIEEAMEFSNKVAPEHLEICTANPFSHLSKIRNAGAVFLGNYTPEPLGDYMAGPSHVLPTYGTARFFSPLSVDDFIKKTSILYFDETVFETLSDDVIKFAEAEGLSAHANSVRVRLD